MTNMTNYISSWNIPGTLYLFAESDDELKTNKRTH